MGANFYLKQNDTLPVLDAVLSDRDGAIDLSTASSVALLMVFDQTSKDLPCTIASAAGGFVRRTFASGDTAVPGRYRAEFEIGWASGAVQTVPNDSYLVIEIKPDLG